MTVGQELGRLERTAGGAKPVNRRVKSRSRLNRSGNGRSQ
jgi:hypothetical protein